MVEPKKDQGAIVRVSIAVALLVAALGITLAILYRGHEEPPEAAEHIAAKLELAAGEVTLVGEDGARHRLASGTPLPEKATLETASGARALVRLPDGTRLFMRDGAKVVLGAVESGGATLEQGELWIEAPPLDPRHNRDPLVHHAGPAEMTLSDGGASVSVSDGQGVVYVAEGLAVVTSESGRREVRAGERAVVEPGSAPAVESVAFWDDWTGGMADRSGAGSVGGGSGTLYAVDRNARPGSPALPLTISRQNVSVIIEDEVAETVVDQYFFNPSDRAVEGYYWFTIPENSMLVSFALETNGVLVEGEVVERKQAAATYEAAVQRAQDPALLEWIDERTVRARIFPVPGLGARRVVVRYQQLLAESEEKLHYTYPLAAPGKRSAPTIEEFSLSVELRGHLAETFDVATLDEARVEAGGKRISMRRSGYTPRADFELELSRKPSDAHAGQSPLRLSELDPGGDQARFVMIRYRPEVDFGAIEIPAGDVVVVVDTSAAGDPAEHQTRVAVAEALLRSLSEGDRFALVRADLTAEVVYPTEGMADANPEAISSALERLSDQRTGGATDLGAIFESALALVHEAEQPAIVYIGDGIVTSGERSSDALAERLRRAMTGSRARLYTVGVGSEVDDLLLARLARVGGGRSSRVLGPEQAVVRALELSGHLKTPTITDLEIDVGEGLDDAFWSATGKITRGEELVLLARTHHELPEEVEIRGRVGGEDFKETVALVRDEGVASMLVPRLWAATYIERLLGDGRGDQAVRPKVLALGLEYGLMSPFTSFLALDTEQAYAAQGIERRPRPLTNLRLHARASFSRSKGEPTVGQLLLGAAMAPLGCSVESGWDPPAFAPGDFAKDAEAPQEVAAEVENEGTAPSSSRVQKNEDGMREKEESSLEEADDVAPAPPAEPEPVPEMAKKSRAAPAKKLKASGEPTDLLADSPSAGDGAGEGEIGLGNVGLIGKGGGGGTGSGYGRGSGAGFGGKGKRVPRVRQAQATVSGPLDKDIVRRIVRAHINEVRSCYNEGLTRDPLLAGRVAVRFVINKRGGVQASVVEEDSLGDQGGKVGRCIARQVKRWKFPKPTGGENVQVLYPFSLDPGNASAPDISSRPRPIAQVNSPVSRYQKLPCTDAASRGLAHRRVLWKRRLERSTDMVSRLRAFEASAGGCEIKGWRDERVYLQLLQEGASTEYDVQLLLAHFRGEPDARNYISNALLRRLVDPNLVAAVEQSMYGSHVDWRAVDRDMVLAEDVEERLEILTKAIARAPGDPGGERRMIQLLFREGKLEEAIARSRRLRDQGMMTPGLAQTLGELLVAHERPDEAKRIFSEIVEFDPLSPASRRLLGDIFFRHGWFEEAYRQYQDLLSLDETQPSASIRLARAAAGTGRVDEGLRRLRQIAGGEGRPGVDDPRRWARLHAAVLLSSMLEDEDTPRKSVERELRRLQLFDAPTTWSFVVWSDLEASLVLGPKPASKDEEPGQPSPDDQAQKLALVGAEAITAGDTGLFAVEVPAQGLGEVVVRHAGPRLDRAVEWKRFTLEWDGSGFKVHRESGKIAAGDAT